MREFARFSAYAVPFILVQKVSPNPQAWLLVRNLGRTAATRSFDAIRSAAHTLFLCLDAIPVCFPLHLGWWLLSHVP